MKKAIVRDVMFLSRKAERMTEKDRQVIQDLKDTLSANRERCVGMAANMIGCSKAAIIVALPVGMMVMLNPEMERKSGPYETEEGCLSLAGARKAIRYREITVRYQDETFHWQKQTFSGYVAQIIQHEMDHLKGILI